MDCYTLDAEGNPVHEPDKPTWLRWFSAHDRSIAATRISGDEPRHEILISTIFEGVDRRHSPDDPPLLWETMVLNGLDEKNVWRYSSAADALAGHERVCREVRAGLIKIDD